MVCEFALPYKSSFETAKGLGEAWNALATVDLYPLPYNRFTYADSAVWWLVPSRDRGAYRYGEVVVSTGSWHARPGCIFCGLHIEKGLETDLQGRKLTLQDDWTWHRYLHELDGAVPVALQKSSAALSADLQLTVVASMGDGSGTADRVVYTTRGMDLEFQREDMQRGVLRGLSKAKSFGALADTLRALPYDDRAWSWFEIFVGSDFEPSGKKGRDDSDRCLAMLKPFEQWLS